VLAKSINIVNEVALMFVLKQVEFYKTGFLQNIHYCLTLLD